MYMSYCKFEGTRQELAVCLGDVMEHLNDEAEYKVSDREIANFRQMVKDFYEFMVDAELLTEEGELDEDMLERICDVMERGDE